MRWFIPIIFAFVSGMSIKPGFAAFFNHGEEAFGLTVFSGLAAIILAIRTAAIEIKKDK